MIGVEYNEQTGTALVATMDVGAIVTMPVPSTSPSIKDDDTSTSIAYWGVQNDFPQKVIEDIKKDTELGPLLEKKALLVYAGGLKWGIPTTVNGKTTLEPLTKEENKPVKEFMRKSNISRYLLEGSTDLVNFYNAFPEIVLSRDKSKIVQLCIQEAANCRWEKQKKGVVKNCYISANWPDEKPENAKKLPVIDPYFDAAEFLRESSKDGKAYNWIYPLSIPTPGTTYYQLARWNGIRESGWLDVSQLVPKSKKYLLEGQLNIKYHIEIHENYWPTKYKDWESLNNEERQKLVKVELQGLKSMLSGVEKAGNSLITALKSDPNYQNTISMWKINVIDDKIKQGQFLEEGKDSSRHKMSAVGLHPALVGTFDNNGMGGAGSNIREAYNLNNFLNRPFQDILLEPLYLIKEFNGWPEDLEFIIENPYMTTLDKGTEVKTPV